MREVTYEIPPEKVDYLTGIKFQNLTNFREKSGLMSLYLQKEELGNHKLRAVGNTESLETF